MQFPESWLRQFCNPPLTTEQLADTLTMGGLEVEQVRPAAPPFSQVVVGAIVEIWPHPNADRLRVCRVDVGQAPALTIVCGAPNARVGIRVPCALPGAELPPAGDGQPLRITKGLLRGVESEGMLCSARELHLSEDHAGLLELALDAPLGQSLREHLQLNDALFTLKLTPNLAHCLSVLGVARELAALTGTPLVEPLFPAVPAHSQEVLPVTVAAPDLCGRFSGRIVRGVNTKARTPDWMVQRLARCGQRSVSALVDISNYVMFELGRPSHIFDLAKISEGLTVRWGRAGERLKLLNGSTVEVDDTVGVIADAHGIESLAGIMGGDATAVSDDTRDVYVEAAFWWPRAVAGRSRRFGFSTDAGHRFERGVDPATTVVHLEHITALILDICGGQACVVHDQVVNLPAATTVHLRPARASKVIGMPLTEAQCLGALHQLGLPAHAEQGVIAVQPPSYRFDLQIEEDLIEEVARMLGYQNLPTTLPRGPISPQLRPEARRSPHGLRRLLATLGYWETINFSFVDERWERELAGNAHPVRLLNPIASHYGVMRSTLLGSLLQATRFNLDRKMSRVRVFEIGRVFQRDASVADTDTTVQGLHQPLQVAAMACGGAEPLQWGQAERAADFFDIKGDLTHLLQPLAAEYRAAEHPAMHPGRCARVWLDGQPVGYVGELHPRWRQAYGLPVAPVMFELSLDACLARTVPAFQPVARLQPVERDIAVIVPDAVSHAVLMQAIAQAPSQGLLQQAQLFDIYRPQQAVAGMAPGERSLAIRLTLCSEAETLTDARIDGVVAAIVAQLAQQLGARLR